mgnify:FL=1
MPNPKPLRILYIGENETCPPALAQLVEKGHTVFQTNHLKTETEEVYLLDYDLILGPNCARFLPGMEQFLPSFLAGARKVRYPKKG